MPNVFRIRAFLSVFLIFSVTTLTAQQIPASAYQNLEYRMIGPFRASRTVGGVGIPSQPNVFFMGVNNGGVWKTDDYGRTWNPIFDDAPTGSVGDIAVALSNPDIIYVGSGEGLHRPDLGVGDGIFKSVDGGKSWEHVGLKDVQQVGRLIVHPTDPDIVIVAGLGHPYGANEQRGVFKTTNGGKTWKKVLYINQNTGAIQVEFDPNNPEILFADMWEHQEGPWENAKFSGPNSGFYKSTDGGENWRKITKGLPGAEQGLGRIGVGIAPSNSNIMFATVDARQNGGIYKSTDAGESWAFLHGNRRLWGRGGDFAEVKVHPTNPDRIYVANVASYTSADGGKTWSSLKGAPGGDDYHRIWINPINPDIMLFVADQGAVVTVNAGRTWSSWYNQPTTQLYHVSTDNDYPYMVYGGQQESGAIGIASRGDGGQISFREFMGVGADEYAYVAPDPKDPNIIYGGRVMRFDKKTGQAQNITPEAVRSGDYRFVRTMPLMFHPADDNMLLFATNVLWKTMNEGQSWEIISPDLTYEQPEVPPSVGHYKTKAMETMARRGVIYAVGPSPLDVQTIWAGTDDGRVHITENGGADWTEVTPPAMSTWDKVSQIDAGHFDQGTAYIAINAIRKDDMTPYVYRTHDGGKTWKLITKGLNPNGPVNVVREDPKQQGLLYAGTEREVYFSVDDGENWQSLRNNMPATSIRDLVIHEDDLVVGTHGRSAWILDNIAPLREMARSKAEGAYLFTPSLTTRVRDNMFHDTPLPPEEPTGQNPPDGAILDYQLNANASFVQLEILSTDGTVIRTYRSDDKPELRDSTTMPHPTYWIKPEQKLGTVKGHHRFIWDLKHEPPRGSRRQFSIAAVYKSTPSGPHGPLVNPGTYRVRLTVDGKVSESPLTIRMDPRVVISQKALNVQHDLSMECYLAYHELQDIVEEIDAMANPSNGQMAFRGNGSVGDPDTMYGSIRATPIERETLVSLQNKLLFLHNVIQAADVMPTTQVIEGVEALIASVEGMKLRWAKMK
ncbi:sialidase family protein [Roseivirga sp. E12]|uniref:WD40/YVTN/BNR-like repeat-containing protein n=1 Tax=Roseivirga sp. E12 TaxID=2819237 RepID=UPI001ABC219E|nr:sialidase family protein [Roseivirga sp. E12]MBO3697697.1 glycoside hydrolase [Roseivirga sp. E12]